MIAILDFGSQTSQLIARRLREAQVYCQLFPCDAPAGDVLAGEPQGFVLSGGPASVYEPGAPQLPDYVLASGKPVLGICYGMQALTHALGGRVAPAGQREYGAADIRSTAENPLLAGEQRVWMSHGDRIEQAPVGFAPIASSDNAPVAAMADLERKLFGVQFHPEVQHTPGGLEMLRRFAVDICGAPADWSPGHIVEQSVAAVRQQVGDRAVLAAISGGVDSSVAAALVHRAIGDQLVAIFVDTGLLRQGERQQVREALQAGLGIELVVVDAAEQFLGDLAGVTDPEEKRSRIGERFIRVFEEQAKALGQPPFLLQGTIYPDVIESRAPERHHAQRIKTHHNVGGLPEDMDFELVEPLRYLFKDEVRQVGLELGLPAGLVWRQPFPGPGLAVRCLGEVTAERLERLRAADAIFTGELEAAGLLGTAGAPLAQAFAVLLPVYSVGVMGDQRTYQECVALRAVSSQDYMTADWARLPEDLLARVSGRIVNEVKGVNRVVYDISSKPPATIEWE
ncbi:MAG: glutamine-hydrolyzing GMP synthase [Anaerolineales bacterium]|nr:glutamine-hydrolyzing GMP synthase [Anaerolineales bacterium]